MLCASLDWQYAELSSSASGAVLYSVIVSHLTKCVSHLTTKKKREKKEEDIQTV